MILMSRGLESAFGARAVIMIGVSFGGLGILSVAFMVVARGLVWRFLINIGRGCFLSVVVTVKGMAMTLLVATIVDL